MNWERALKEYRTLFILVMQQKISYESFVECMEAIKQQAKEYTEKEQ